MNSTPLLEMRGVYHPEEGELLVDGKPVTIHNVNDSMALGFGFIHQELNILDNLDIAGNIFLGREPLIQPFQIIDRKKIHADTAPLLKRLGLHIPSTTLLCNLSIAHQQMVEIAKALSLNARIIIMDEPTSSLTLTETDCLLGLIAGLRAEGVSVIYISHRLGEVSQCADRVEVLRDGKNAGGLSRGEGLVIGMSVRENTTLPSLGSYAASGIISSDMEEVLHLSDRIAVMHEGRITGVLVQADCRERNVMQLAGGRPVASAKPPFSP